MTETKWAGVWDRVRAGHHTLVTGATTVPHEPSDLKILRIDCTAAQSGRGVLGEVLANLEALFGQPLPSGWMTPEPGLSRQLLGQHIPQPLETIVTDACNRFAAWASGHAALVLEAVDSLDEATLDTLQLMLQRPNWLRLPMVLTVVEHQSGPSTRLAGILGTEAVVALPDGAMVKPFDWMSLPPDALRVLRAGAVLGATFQADAVAELLDEPLGHVLDRLQIAADAGAPLIDRSDGRFSLPLPAIKTLQARTLPSLLAFWHERAGDCHAGSAARQPAASAPPPVSAQPEPTPSPYPGIFDTEPTEHTPATTEPSEPAVAAASTPSATPTAGGSDQARAAAHLHASGRTEAAAERYLAAVGESTTRGDARRALLLAEQGLKLLEELPPTSRRSLLRAGLMLAAGKVKWQAAVLGSPFTLQGAQESLQAAREQLPHSAPAELLGELAAVTAGVSYDLGDTASLTACLDELAAASRRLLTDGNALTAARLLNEQAALLTRLTQPHRAAELLDKSRAIFENRLQQDAADRTALEELAQTYHLLARLPLHARVRPGREAEAYATALDQALAAERAYGKLGQERALAHVWDTMGRLELARGRLDAAARRLNAAFERLRELGDVTGLARTTAALAELSIHAGQLDEALDLLGDSITLNAEKGSPIGLAFNRRTLTRLTEAAARTPMTTALQTSLNTLDQRLAQAESVFGRATLPGMID